MRPSPAAHLRAFQPLTAFPDAVQTRLMAGARRTRAEVEAEAEARARARLLRRVADPFPEAGEEDLVRTLAADGSVFYCPDELALRAEMAAAVLEEATPPGLFEAAVPTVARVLNRNRVLVALEDEWGLSPDGADGDGAHDDGAHHRIPTRTALWGVPHAWLTVFDPEEPVPRLVDGEEVAYRRTPLTDAVERAAHAAAVLAQHAPEAELLPELTSLLGWLRAFHPDGWLELDYAGLTPHVWPDDSVFDLWTLLDALEEGDEGTAGVAQERLNRRWGPVGMRAHAG